MKNSAKKVDNQDPPSSTAEHEHRRSKYLTVVPGGLAALAVLASFMALISHGRSEGLFDRKLLFFAKHHQDDQQVCQAGAVFARCGAYLDATACGQAENGDACVCAESAENGDALCIQVWRFDSEDPLVTPDKCNTTADCSDSQVCVQTEEYPENFNRFDNCTIADWIVKANGDEVDYTTKFCLDLCSNVANPDDSNPVRCPAIDGETCPEGEYLMKSCDGFFVDQKICTADVAGLQEQGLRCDSTFSCGKEWVSFLPTVVAPIPLKADTESYSYEKLEQVARLYNGNIDDGYAVVHNLLDEEDCRAIREFTDEQYLDLLASGAKVNNKEYKYDYRLNVPQGKFEQVIKPSSVERLVKAFRDFAKDIPIVRIALRRTVNDGTNSIAFHADSKNTSVSAPTLVAMITYLNEEGDIDGGDLHYMTGDGVFREHPGRGSSVIHGGKVVHGVDAYNGTRYIMLLLGQTDYAPDMLPAFGYGTQDMHDGLFASSAGGIVASTSDEL